MELNLEQLLPNCSVHIFYFVILTGVETIHVRQSPFVIWLGDSSVQSSKLRKTSSNSFTLIRWGIILVMKHFTCTMSALCGIKASCGSFKRNKRNEWRMKYKRSSLLKTCLNRLRCRKGVKRKRWEVEHGVILYIVVDVTEKYDRMRSNEIARIGQLFSV
jgi:hypothetical protein